MKVTVITVIVGALGTVSNGLEKNIAGREISGRFDTVRTSVLLRTAWILRRILET